MWLACEQFSMSFEPQFSYFASVAATHFDPKLLFDLAPQITSSLIILGMSFERYILVCYARDAKRILKKPRRLVIYVVVLTLIIISWGLLLLDFFKPFLFSDNLSEFSVSFAVN